MSQVESSPLPCSIGCIFGKDCAKMYSRKICKDTVDNQVEKFIKQPTEEKTVRDNKITAAMTDDNGKITISEGWITIEVKKSKKAPKFQF